MIIFCFRYSIKAKAGKLKNEPHQSTIIADGDRGAWIGGDMSKIERVFWYWI